jgi:arachidonate 15-lipoxygenase
MSSLFSSVSELAGEAVEAAREIVLSDDEFAPVERPCLPSQDTNAAERAEWLADARQRWQFEYDYIQGMAVLKIDGITETSLSQAVRARKYLPREARPPVDYIPLRAASLTALARSTLRERVSEGLVADTGPVDDIADYNRIVRRPLKLPETCERWTEDRVFAWQRVAGANPLVIQGIDAIPDHVSLTDDRLAGVWREGLHLADELAAGNVFMVDLFIVHKVGTATDDSGTRQVWPAVGIFHVDRTADANAPLMPLAIQLGAEANPNLVFTPNDGPRWTIAKVALQCADITLHEMGTHLGRAHFGLESLVVAAYRSLSHRHPLMVLLQPHFRIVLFNNFEGRELLVNEGGKVDTLMAGGRAGELHLVRESAVTGETDDPDGSPQTRPISLDNFDLPRDLRERRATNIPQYPYAEDGLAVWEAIFQYCTEYINVYYNDDHAVQNDAELQEYVRLLGAHDGARLADVPAVQTRTAVADLMTRVIYASGPQHSAINFAQYEAAASASNVPLALYRALPPDLHTWDDQRASAFLLELLPPIEKAKAQLSTIVELTSFHYDQLGHFKPGDFKDPIVEPIIERFQERLAALDHTIEARNSERFMAYPFLQPQNILNSTSI